MVLTLYCQFNNLNPIVSNFCVHLVHAIAQFVMLQRLKQVNPDSPKPHAIKVCTICFTKLYQGCRHQCSEYRYCHKKLYNLEEMIGSPTTSQRIASRSMDNYSDQGLLTYGPKRKSLDSPPSLKRKLFSLDDMCVIRKNLDLSTRQTLTLAQNLREASGSRSIIE